MIVSQQKCQKNIPNIQIRQLQRFLILNRPEIFLDLAILGVNLESAVSSLKTERRAGRPLMNVSASV